jgi:hypothetical protein
MSQVVEVKLKSTAEQVVRTMAAVDPFSGIPLISVNHERQAVAMVAACQLGMLQACQGLSQQEINEAVRLAQMQLAELMVEAMTAGWTRGGVN